MNTPAPQETPRVEEIVNEHCACGENPLWDAARGRVLWTDIPNGRIYAWDRASGRHEILSRGAVTGGFTLQADGTLLLFQANRFARLRPDGREEVLGEGIDDGMERFNDVIADPEGRVYAGTIGRTRESGGLYRVERDGSAKRLFTGTGCANGMAFSPDLRRLWWTCSTTRKIFEFDYDRASGELSNRRLFHAAEPGTGTPDGLTVDAEGLLWSARWGGHAVLRHDPSGRVVRTVRFPVAKVSSVVFGGPDLDELYVTTAGGSEGAATADGALYRVKGLARGLPEFRSRVVLDRS
jgi:D-xylonolactonase